MGFRDARRRILRSLDAGDYQFEVRSVVEGKNLLETGEVTPEDVAGLLRRCRGDQYDCVPHHADRSVPVHIFRPQLEGARWYVKAYLVAHVDDEGVEDFAVFISVHRSVRGGPGRGR